MGNWGLLRLSIAVGIVMFCMVIEPTQPLAQENSGNVAQNPEMSSTTETPAASEPVASTEAAPAPELVNTDETAAPEPVEATPVAEPETSPSVEPTVAPTEPESVETAKPEDTEKKLDYKAGQQLVNRSVREFFDGQTHAAWKYLRPYLLLRTGVIYEQFDETNVVLRRAGFKLFDAQLGFRSAMDPFPISKNWDFELAYKFTASFASGASVSDAYIEAAIKNYWFTPRLRIGYQKVPFMWAELQSDSELYFYDRPQYARPYGAKYASFEIGLHRNAGAGLKLGFFDEVFCVEGGIYYPSNPKEENWGVGIVAVRAELDTKKLIHDKVRIEAGAGYYRQEKMAQYFENSREAVAVDARLHVYGAFIGGEWVLHEMNDGVNNKEYRRLSYKNNYTHAMGYQVFAGYSFPNREYELAVRYQWYDPDDTNLIMPIPQSANQALRWVTASVSWWPIDLLRIMVNYTHKQELEAAETTEYSEERLKDLKNDEVILQLQLLL